MPLEERRVEINGLTPGMYVCRLDRPWTETPYPLQGFLVESPAITGTTLLVDGGQHLAAQRRDVHYLAPGA